MATIQATELVSFTSKQLLAYLKYQLPASMSLFYLDEFSIHLSILKGLSTPYSTFLSQVVMTGPNFGITATACTLDLALAVQTLVIEFQKYTHNVDMHLTY